LEEGFNAFKLEVLANSDRLVTEITHGPILD